MARTKQSNIPEKDRQHAVGILLKIRGLLNSWGRPGSAKEIEEVIKILGGTP